MSEPMKLDGVLLEILRHRLQAIAEEMAEIILRTGHTIFIKETADFGAMLVTREGELFAIPQRTGVNILAGLDMREAIHQIDCYEEGDVIFCNDPYSTAGMITHLPDLFLWKPIFHEGELLCFAATFIHSSDVGGKVPGSISPTNHEIYQEGIRFPPVKLFRRGELNEELRKVFLTNCRIPEQNWGDLSAMLAALATAETRIEQVIGRYGLESIEAGINGVLDYAETRVRSLIGEMTDGRHVFWDYMEGDQFDMPPIRVKVTLDIKGDELWCDFSGTEMQVRGAFNLASYNVNGHYMLVIAFVNLLRTLDPNLPSNSGIVRPIHMYAPPGTLLNPDPPAALGVRAATMYRVIDVTMATLGRVRPDILPAAGGGMGAIILIASPDLESGKLRVSVAQPLRGGSGGRPRQDGIDGTNFQGGWLRNIPNEAFESDMPVIVRRYGLRADSGGPGKTRGGSGVVFGVKLFAPDSTMTARGMERYTFRPWGRDGGKHGTLGKTLLRRNGEAEPTSIGKIDALYLGPGDEVTFLTQGGGGLGDPLERDTARVLADIESGVVSVDGAREDYGVMVVDGAVDAAATERRRSELRAARDPLKPYDFGPEREAFEAIWSDELQTALLDLLFTQPRGIRTYYKTQLVKHVEELANRGQPVGPADLPGLLERIKARAGVEVMV